MAEAAKRRIVFMGTPAFAGSILERLLSEDDFEVVAVFTRPDAASGRGLEKKPPEVKKIAQANGIPVHQPQSLKDPAWAELVASLKPDFIVVASYGLILPQAILDVALPINVHASLLPRFRGAAPIQRAIMDGWQKDAKTGVSIMRMEKGLDTGPVYMAREVPLENRGFGAVAASLASAGADLLVETLAALPGLEPVPQNNALATYAEKIGRDEGIVDWHRPAAEIAAKIRALEEWPGVSCVFHIGGEDCPVILLEGAPAVLPERSEPGRLYAEKGKLYAGCGDGWLEILKLKPKGGKSMGGQAFVNGRCRVRKGDCGIIAHEL